MLHNSLDRGNWSTYIRRFSNSENLGTQRGHSKIVRFSSSSGAVRWIMNENNSRRMRVRILAYCAFTLSFFNFRTSFSLSLSLFSFSFTARFASSTSPFPSHGRAYTKMRSSHICTHSRETHTSWLLIHVAADYFSSPRCDTKSHIPVRMESRRVRELDDPRVSD